MCLSMRANGQTHDEANSHFTVSLMCLKITALFLYSLCLYCGASLYNFQSTTRIKKCTKINFSQITFRSLKFKIQLNNIQKPPVCTSQWTFIHSFIHSFIHLAFHIIHTDVEPVIKGSMQQHLFTTQNNKIYPQ